MRRPFKMKGYSYPGKSPVKRKDDPSSGDQSQFQDQPEETITSADVPDEQTGASTLAADKKTKRGEFWKGLAGQAGMALLETGLQIGATALTTPRRKPSRKGPDTSGFSNIQFGRRS